MNSRERRKAEFTVRMHLRDSLDKLQTAGKSFDEMRGFVARFVEEQLYDLTKGHEKVTASLRFDDFEKRGELKQTYDQLCLALQNCRDGVMKEIKFREEKNAQKEAQTKQ